MSSTQKVFETEICGNVLVLVPTGSFLEFRDNDIRNAYNDAYRILHEPDVQHLLVDFSELEYFGSTFVGILIRLARKVRGDGGEAVLCNLSDNMKDMLRSLMLLENTRTDFFWRAFADRPAAFASLPGVSGPPTE